MKHPVRVCAILRGLKTRIQSGARRDKIQP